MLIWLSEPFLSLIDTTVVAMTQGRSATTQLASLGPATTLIDSALYLTYFLAIATTNLISRGLAMKDYRKLRKTTSNILGVATLLGLATSVVCWTLGYPILRGMAGLSGSPELLWYAYRYTSIRAVAGVTSVLGMVSQSFLLANLDTKTCAKAVLAASGVNLVGDVALSRWGVQGAAVATAASSIVSCTILMRAVRKKLAQWRRMENADFEPSSRTNRESTEVESERDTSIPMLSLPDKKSFVQLLTLSGPIFFVILSTIACYSGMTLKVADYGVATLATHSIMYRVFFVFGTFGDSISQAAQSFMPSTIIPTLKKHEFRTLLRRLVITAGVIGTLNSQLSIWILKNLGTYLTKDAQILELLRHHAGWLGTALILHPLILILEGTVTAAREFRTLLATYSVTLCIHFSMLKWYCKSFPSVWRTFLVFQCIRLANFAFHVWKTQRKELPNGKHPTYGERINK